MCKLLANFDKTKDYTNTVHQCYMLFFLPFSRIYVLGAKLPPRDSNTDVLM